MGHDFFENPECRYFPCHQGDIEDFNCLFCFCPMYHIECLGEPGYIEIKGKLVKDCSRCLYPHRPENYETIIEYLRLLLVEEI
ncbi:MAG: metal-binding protein [Nitrospirae bacterium]|nr:MAG: metal-binding protein [Nitrospirota bacterium]